MLPTKTIFTTLRDGAPPVARTYSTEQTAEILHVRPQSLRAALCRHGHYFGVVPIKLRNRLLAWPADQVAALSRGEVSQ